MKKYNIPVQDLLQGTFLSLDNSDRHRKDAEVLAEKNRYNSAIVSLYIAIEEFAKALWLTHHLIKLKGIDEKEGKKFTDHRYKLNLFLEYVDKIDGYKRSSGTNEFVKMAEKIADEQEYKLKMLYIDYDGSIQKRTYWNYSNWWNPNYIWQISWIGDYDSNFPLSTKYNELKKDLEAAIVDFRTSELFRSLRKIQLPKIINTNEVFTFIENHFLFKEAYISMSGHASSKSIEVSISPPKSQSWFDEALLKTIEGDLKKIYKVNDVKVEIFRK